MLIIENAFDLGQIVYLKTDELQLLRIVTSIQICPSSALLYRVSCGVIEYWASEIEISKQKNVEPELVQEPKKDNFQN